MRQPDRDRRLRRAIVSPGVVADERVPTQDLGREEIVGAARPGRARARPARALFPSYIRGAVDRLFSDPEDVDRWFDVASLLRQNGCFHGALEAYDQAVGRFSTEIDSMWWSNRGWLLQLWERYGDAVASFRRALDLNPTYERPRIGLQDVQRLLDTLDSDSAPVGESRDVDAGRVPQPYESRRLHRIAGKGGQKRTRAYESLSPANLAIEASESHGASFDAITHTWLSRSGPSGARRLRDDHVYFISYRWESVPHRQWVFQFATDLERRGYRVIHDQFESLGLRDRIGPALRTDRMQDEIPRLVEDLGRATVFVPILTEGYRRCVEPRRTGNPAAGLRRVAGRPAPASGGPAALASRMAERTGRTAPIFAPPRRRFPRQRSLCGDAGHALSPPGDYVDRRSLVQRAALFCTYFAVGPPCARGEPANTCAVAAGIPRCALADTTHRRPSSSDFVSSCSGSA